MPPKAKGGKKKGGYQMPEKFTEGFVLKDIFKTNWTLGKPIGQGGFGLIYLAYKGEVKGTADYVVKIEPKDNGPLFCETHFYINCAKEDEIKNFIKAYGLKHLAIPKYISSGLCTYNEKEYRFLVMDRFLKDLQTVVNETPSHQINEVGAMCLMRQIMYSLEYIHRKGYAHGDIKGANLMLKNDHESYLVDFGLAQRFKRDDVHQKYEIKPERRHNGTIEYTSRDAHCGALCNRRSDLEILGYCIIHWLSGTLPWIGLISNNEQVQQSKIKNMANVKDFIKSTLGSVNNISESVKSFIEFYLNEVNKLEHDHEPPYAKIHAKINDVLKALGHSASAGDNFYLFSGAKKTSSKAAVVEAKPPAETNGAAEEAAEEKPRGGRKRQAKTAKPSQSEGEDSEPEREKPKPKRTPAVRKNAAKAAEVVVDSENEAAEPEKELTSKKPRNGREKAEHTPSTGKRTGRKEAINYQEDSEEEESTRPKSPKTAPKPSTKRTNGKLVIPDSDSEHEIQVKPSPAPKKPLAENGNGKHALLETPPSKYPLRHTPTRLLTPTSHSDTQTYEPEAPLNAAQRDVLEKMKPTAASAAADPKMNAAQLDVINRIKSTSALGSPGVKSPLALGNLEKKSSVMLVKKRKNVPRATVHTQTDKSYIADLHKSQGRFF